MVTKWVRPKYQVQRLKNTGPEEVCELVGKPMLATDPEDIDSPFVLMPRKDPAAYEAVRIYAMMCEPQLGNEIRTWLRKVIESEPVYGTQGKRNRAAMRMRFLNLSE